MNKAELYQVWLEEESIAHIKGWDFSHIDNKYEEETDFPWDYREVVQRYLSPEASILDIDTGGGEFLLSLGHPYDKTAATGAFAPNVQICKETLLPLGIDFREADGKGELPFENARFDVVIDRHGDFNAEEIWRVLKPGGVFVTQQVGAENDRELVELLMTEVPGLPFPEQYVEISAKKFEDAGFEIVDKQEAFCNIRFRDVGALVWFARIIEWEFPGFSVDSCLENLYRAQAILEQEGAIRGTTHRFLMVARKRKKTLYITDLDGTLLNREKCIPEESLEILNRLIETGMIFSYATARSIVSASDVTKGLKMKMPVVTGNGVSIVNPQTRELIATMSFGQEGLARLIAYMRKYQLYPLVHSYINGKEKTSWVKGKETEGLLGWLKEPVRKVDDRLNPVGSFEELFQGQVFYMTCMGLEADFVELAKELEQDSEYRYYLTKELYDDSYWLEIMPAEATKSNTVLKLKEMLGCDRMVCFGDGINDISMFEAADECYAMENGVEELKAIATGVIGSNEESSVAKWLEGRAKESLPESRL